MHHSKNWFNYFFVVVLLAVFQSCAFAAVSPTGIWKTYNADGNPTSLTKISVNSGELRGVVQKVLAIKDGHVVETCDNCQGENQGKPLVGMTIAWGFHQMGDGQWTGGNILEVRTGKVRPAKITVSPDGNTMNVTVSSGPFTRTVQWVREQ